MRPKPAVESRIALSGIERTLPRPAVSVFQAPVQLPVIVLAPQLSAPIELAIEAPPIPSAQLPKLVAGPIRTGMLEETRAEPASAPRRLAAGAAGFNSELPPEASPAPAAKPAARLGAFGDASTATPAPRSAVKTGTGITSAVEILGKPRPLYTAEARSAGIQGEVLLDVLFRASGDCQVLRLVRGLGHGLDESAAQAARQISFRPARRDGLAVDSSAIVHISFELAF
jgi:TonB family protein